MPPVARHRGGRSAPGRLLEGLHAPMTVNPKKLRPYDEPPRQRGSAIPGRPDSAARGFMVMALLWLAAATGIGVLWVAIQLFPDQLTFSFDIPMPVGDPLGFELSSATVASGFTNAVVFGWIANGGLAAIFFITPRILGVRLADEPMAFLAMLLWNVGVAAGIGLVYLPMVAATGPLAEFPLPVDGALLLAMTIATYVFFRTVIASGDRLPYVSLWFFGVAMLAFLGAYALGSAFPLLSLGETPDALVAAWVARVIGIFWVTGVGLGAIFYVVPRATGNPLYSSALAAAAWLLWAGFGALSTVGALVDTSVPYAITSLGNAGTILLVAPFVLAVANLAISMQGRWTLALTPGAAGFALVALAFLLASALLEAIGALRSVQGLVGQTEWGMGVWLFSTLGFTTFALYALLDHAGPRLFRRDWRGSQLTDAQLWATFAGVALAGLALMAGGIAHGSLVLQGAAAEEISSTLAWFRVVAGAGIGLAAVGGLSALVGLFIMYTTARPADHVVGPGSAAVAAGH
jgi:cbb3-type cytochrome oxidase subunit 1